METQQATQRKKLTLKANRNRPSVAAPQRAQRAAPAHGRVTRSGGSEYTFHAVLAIIAALIFIALIVIQYLELSEYSKFPNVWPVVEEEMVVPISTPSSDDSGSVFAE